MKPIEQLKLKLLTFCFFLLLPKGGPLLKNIFFTERLNENGVFEAFFLATWTEAQSWKQLIFIFLFF